ncbi:MAG: cation diffusion facilitator family transporter [Marinobacterium sp.]|nr:cation diffusion facilitator family transporter [Marinobacterium sp.]
MSPENDSSVSAHDKAVEHSAERITWIGAALDAVLGILKITVGLLSQSGALIADGIHSLSDLATDALVVVTLRLSRQPADAEHPWGHGRIETLGTTLLGAALLSVAGAMGWDSLQSLMDDQPSAIPEWPALLVALLSIISKEMIYRYTRAVGERLNSDLLIANAWHSRTDALSSVVVFIGIGASLLGMPWMDSLAAVLVAVMVGHIGWSLSWRSLQQLIDTAPPAEDLDRIRGCACEIQGVHDLHDLKVRYTGTTLAMELHILIDPLLSASEGHFIAEQVQQKLQSDNPQLQQVIIHIDTRDDEAEEAMQAALLLFEDAPDAATGAAQGIRPERRVILDLLHPWLEAHALQLLRLDIHYQRDTLALELCLEWPEAAPVKTPVFLVETLRQHLNNPGWLERIRISYGVDG